MSVLREDNYSLSQMFFILGSVCDVSEAKCGYCDTSLIHWGAQLYTE